MAEIDHRVIMRVSMGDEEAFAVLYEAYYAYLNTLAAYYVFDRNVANEIVNDIFVNLWKNRESLTYPINNYLVRAVRNASLNQIRNSRTRNEVHDRYRAVLDKYHEEHILNNPNPLQYVEMQELEQIIKSTVASLPEKCRMIVESYLFNGKSPADIADETGLNISTVRVQIKNGLDKMRLSLGNLMVLLLLINR